MADGKVQLNLPTKKATPERVAFYQSTTNLS